MTRWLTLIAASVFAADAFSFQIVRTADYSLPTNQVAHEQIVVLADMASVQGAVHDDLFVAAMNTVQLSGTASNDVWLIGQTVYVSGVVGDHVRLVGNTVTFGGTAGNSLCAAGAAMQVTTGAVVNGSVTLIANSAAMSGHAGGKVRIMAQQATFAGSCDGDVRIIADDIIITPGAVIRGDLIYTSARDLILDPKVQLGGQLVRKAVEPSAAPHVSLAQAALTQLFFVLGAFLCGMFFISYFPRFSQRAVATLRTSPAKCALAGLLGLCLLPMLALLAVVTLVGLPLAALLLAAFVVMSYLGKLVVALLVGSLVAGEGIGIMRRALTLLVGLIVLYALPLVPGAAMVVWFLVEFLGLGAMMLALHDSQRLARAPDLPVA